MSCTYWTRDKMWYYSTVCILIIVLIIILRRVRRAEGPVLPARAVRLSEVTFRSGDLILLHETPRISFLVGAPWTHVMVALSEHQVCDIRPWTRCGIHNTYDVLRRKLLQNVIIGIRRIDRGADSVNITMHAVQKQRRLYTHDYVLPVVNQHCWFLGTLPNPMSLFCSSFVADLLVQAGIFIESDGMNEMLPHDFAECLRHRLTRKYNYESILRLSL